MGIQLDRRYANGEHIACQSFRSTGTGYICAFLQRMPDGAVGSQIRDLAPHLTKDRHCRVCGSVPWDYPLNNDVNNGMLTYNAVSRACSDGLC